MMAVVASYSAPGTSPIARTSSQMKKLAARQPVEPAGGELHPDGIVLGGEPERRVLVGEEPVIAEHPGAVADEVAEVAGDRPGQSAEDQRGEPAHQQDDYGYQVQRVDGDELGYEQQQPEGDGHPVALQVALDEERWRLGRAIDGTDVQGRRGLGHKASPVDPPGSEWSGWQHVTATLIDAHAAGERNYHFRRPPRRPPPLASVVEGTGRRLVP